MIPYERAWTLVGTTDVPVAGDAPEAQHPQISDEEIAYLCEAASRYSARPITPEQVIWRYSGVRPLFDDGSDNPSAVTRDYHLMLDFRAAVVRVRRQDHHPPPRLAESVVAPRAVGCPAPFLTHASALPGGT
jgi:glycerol-3-phosphate dehydrogenase